MPWLSINPKMYLTNLLSMCINTHMDSLALIKMLQKDGWYKADQSDSHIQFRHPSKKGRVTVPHPKKDIPIGTLRSIERQSGIKFK
jgi:predicted RNA binding protein YcfA (HicA-like mRNA interferase family)